MKDRKTMKSGMIWLLFSVLLSIALVFIQTPARAQVDCSAPSASADYDGDGFTDEEECNTSGIILADGTPFTGLDPTKKDLFVIWIPATPSNLLEDPFQYLRNLQINVHQIDPEQATSSADYTQDRIVSPGSSLQQKAVRVTESLDTTTPNLMGIANEGTPLGRGNATVFTENIKNFVNTVYSNSPPSDVIPTYIKHTIAHEVGHVLRPLAQVSQRDYVNFGGYHYKSGTNVIMDQSVYYTSKGGKITFYIGTDYTAGDKAAVKLR